MKAKESKKGRKSVRKSIKKRAKKRGRKPVTKKPPRSSAKKFARKKTADERPGPTHPDYLKCDDLSKWIIVELTEDAILEEHIDAVERSILQCLGSNIEYFIPIYREKIQGKFACLVLFDGYLFIKEEESIRDQIYSLKNDYIRGPLRNNHTIQTVSGKKILEFKKEMLKKIKSIIPRKRSKVVPIVGTFSNLLGEVLSVDRKKLTALVRFKKSTRVVDAPINVINLQPHKENGKSKLLSDRCPEPSASLA